MEKISKGQPFTLYLAFSSTSVGPHKYFQQRVITCAIVQTWKHLLQYRFFCDTTDPPSKNRCKKRIFDGFQEMS